MTWICRSSHPRSGDNKGSPPAGKYAQSIEKSNEVVDLPTLALPKKRPDFVDDVGGGGFWIWEAVGARDWRME